MRMIILLLFGTMESDSRLVAEPTGFPSSEIEKHLSRTFLTVPRDYTEQDSSAPSDSTLFSPLFAPFHPQRYEAKKQEQSKVSSNHCLSSCLTSFSVYQNRCSNAFFDCLSDVGEACGQSEFLALCKMDRASCVTSGLNELQSCQASCEQSNTSCGCLTECQLDMEKSLHFVNIQHDSCVINCDNDAACLQTCHNQLASGEESVASMFEECYLFCCVPDAGECDRTCDTATAVCLDHCLEDYKYCKLEFSADKPERSSFDRSREPGQEIRFTSSSFQASFDSQRSCPKAEPRTPQTILRSSFCEEMKTKCDDMCQRSGSDCHAQCDSLGVSVCPIQCKREFKHCTGVICEEKHRSCLRKASFFRTVQQNTFGRGKDAVDKCQTLKRQCEKECADTLSTCEANCPSFSFSLTATAHRMECTKLCESEFDSCIDESECSQKKEIECYRTRRNCNAMCDAEEALINSQQSTDECCVKCHEKKSLCLEQAQATLATCSEKCEDATCQLLCDNEHRLNKFFCHDDWSFCCDDCPERCLPPQTNTIPLPPFRTPPKYAPEVPKPKDSSWDSYIKQCSINYEKDLQTRFQENCKGKVVAWTGYATEIRPDSVNVLMDPTEAVYTSSEITLRFSPSVREMYGKSIVYRQQFAFVGRIEALGNKANHILIAEDPTDLTNVDESFTWLAFLKTYGVWAQRRADKCFANFWRNKVSEYQGTLLTTFSDEIHGHMYRSAMFQPDFTMGEAAEPAQLRVFSSSHLLQACLDWDQNSRIHVTVSFRSRGRHHVLDVHDVTLANPAQQLTTKGLERGARAFLSRGLSSAALGLDAVIRTFLGDERPNAQERSETDTDSISDSEIGSQSSSYRIDGSTSISYSRPVSLTGSLGKEPEDQIERTTSSNSLFEAKAGISNSTQILLGKDEMPYVVPCSPQNQSNFDKSPQLQTPPTTPFATTPIHIHTIPPLGSDFPTIHQLSIAQHFGGITSKIHSHPIHPAPPLPPQATTYTFPLTPPFLHPVSPHQSPPGPALSIPPALYGSERQENSPNTNNTNQTVRIPSATVVPAPPPSVHPTVHIATPFTVPISTPPTPMPSSTFSSPHTTRLFTRPPRVPPASKPTPSDPSQRNYISSSSSGRPLRLSSQHSTGQSNNKQTPHSIKMLSNPGSSSFSVQQSSTSSSNQQSSTPNEWLEKVESLKTESDENKVRQSQEMVNACLEDCGHKKGTVHKLMEARILPILALELRNTESREVRIGFQALFDIILLVLSENGATSLSKHFPTLLALSQNTNVRIAEPVIETIGLITHNLSSRAEVDEFLRSGILEWLVNAVRTHPDGQVRQAIVVGLGEIGFGLKKAVVREKGGDEGWKREEKKSEKEAAASSVDEQGRRDRQAGRWMLGGSVSRADLLSLGSESWVEEDTGAMDLASRCRRGVRMAGQALIGVLRGWEKKPADQKGNKKKNEGQREEEEEREWENDVGVLEAAGSVCGLIFPEVYTERRKEKQDRISVSGEDLEEMKRKMEQMEQFDSERKKKAMEREAELLQSKKDAETIKTLQAQLDELKQSLEKEKKEREAQNEYQLREQALKARLNDFDEKRGEQEEEPEIEEEDHQIEEEEPEIEGEVGDFFRMWFNR
ncbi:hypothetical protein BLNAU_18225 [Blattamonas nauphoetae]|uniref:Uncharacterized protein n=1 Tax=Blattamonas nauphoetae TaxID=2049346 RepID=A0ABQ9X4Z9_9EUKA|nr:hypothetical protein BLNAU_18225 [Blattamonas nauphoetae]